MTGAANGIGRATAELLLARRDRGRWRVGRRDGLGHRLGGEPNRWAAVRPVTRGVAQAPDPLCR